MKYIVRILNDRYETIKTIDGFEHHATAVKFAKTEKAWRGCPVAVVLIDKGQIMGYTQY